MPIDRGLLSDHLVDKLVFEEVVHL